MSDPYPRSVPDEEHVQRIMRDFGLPEDEAWKLLAIERGEIDGDATLT